MKNLGKIIISLLIIAILSFIFILFRTEIIALDENLFYTINGFSNPMFDLIFIPVTYFGSLIFWILLIIIFWLKKEKKISIYLMYALIIDSLLSSLKWVFSRPRPPIDFLKDNFFVERTVGPSFPSTHAERAFSGAVILGHFSGIKFKVILYVLSVLTAISRIYLGAHYPIDVLFGSLIGILIGNVILNLPTKHVQEKIENLAYRIKIFFQKL